MSRTNPTPGQMSIPNWPPLPRVFRCLGAIASAVVRRATKQAHRELVALDDRTLADIGLVRADLMSLLETLTVTRTAAVLSPSIWNCPRPGA